MKIEEQIPYGYKVVSATEAAQSDQRATLFAFLVLVPMIICIIMTLMSYEAPPDNQNPHGDIGVITTW